MKKDISKQLRREILPILKKHDIAKSAVFGSFVKGEMKKIVILIF